MIHAFLAYSLALACPIQEQGAQGGYWRLFEQKQPLRVLLDTCATLLGESVEYPVDQVGALVALQLSGPISTEELWRTTNRLLVEHGLTTVQMPGSPSISVVKLEDAARLARLDNLDREPPKAGFVKILARLQAGQADAARALITPVLSGRGSVETMPAANTLLISDLTPHVYQALEVVEFVEGFTGDAELVEVGLEQTLPTYLIAALERYETAREAVLERSLSGKVLPSPAGRSVFLLAPERELEIWRDLIVKFDRAESVSTVSYQPRRFGVEEVAQLIQKTVPASAIPDSPPTLKVITDELTGTLVVTATSSQHIDIELLLERLESTEHAPRKRLRSFPVKNRSAAELLDLLEQMLGEGGAIAQAPTPSEEPSIQGPTGEIPSDIPAPVAALAREPGEYALSVDEATNRILAFAEPAQLAELKELIRGLDVRSTQVLIEVLVVTLSESQSQSLGVELQYFGEDSGTLYRLSSLFGLGSPDAPDSALPPAGGTGFSGVALDPGEFSVVLRALETINEGRSLTLPKVLVSNNTEASLDSVLQTPYISTNASNTVATTSFGGSLDAGTTILVKPQIVEADQLILDYTVTLSTFVGEPSDPALPPPRQENSLKSIAIIPDGYTVAIGGLEVETEAEGVSKTPVLGDIPLLGALFQNRSTSTTKSTFFVFLRCNVLRNSSFQDLRHLGRPQFGKAALDDNWPALKPRIIR